MMKKYSFQKEEKITEIFRQNIQKTGKENPSRNSLSLMLTYRCPYKCSYCGVTQKNSDMPKKVLLGAIDYLSKERKPILKFFGGEPLLRFDLIKDAIEYSKKNGYDIRFSLVTSGIGLNKDMIEFIKENDIKVMFSIDGDRKSNTHRFPGKSNTRIFYEIKDNLKSLILADVDVFVNMVISPKTSERLRENIRFLEGFGVKRIQLGYQIGTLWSRKKMESLEKELRKVCREFPRERIMNYCNMCEPVILSQEVIVDVNGSVYYDGAVFVERFFPELRSAYYIGNIKNLENLESLEMDKERIFDTFLSLTKRDHEKKLTFLNNLEIGLMFNDVFPPPQRDKRADSENPVFKKLLYGDFESQERFKSKNNIHLESLFLYIDTSCENNCIFCRNKDYKDSDIRDIESKLRKNRKLKKSKISLVGNDVLLHEKIIEIIELCKKYGFKKIEIMTSGNRLADEKMVKTLSDIDAQIIFSLPLFGRDAKTHDSITQNTGSFESVIKGLENIKRHKNLDAIIHTNLLKQNMDSIHELELFVKKHLKLRFTILPIRPKDSIIPYNELAPTYKEMVSSLKVSSLMGFPFCVTKRVQERLIPDYDDISDAMKLYFLDQNFVKLKRCAHCIYLNKCPGTFREYVKHNSTKAIEPSRRP